MIQNTPQPSENIEAQSQVVSGGEQRVAEAPLATELPTEQGVVQENMPTQQPPATTTSATAAPVDPVQPASQTDDECKEEFSGKIPATEDAWIKEAEGLMKQYDNQPYAEEEAEEDLHLKYMNNRFGLNIEKGDHKKKK